MADDYAALDAYIARLRALPGMARRAAPEVADALRELVLEQIGAGKGPDGQPLQLTQDGRTPLTTGGHALSVGAVGGTVILRLRGHVARHHLGRAAGGLVRQLLPTSRKLPAAYVRAIKSTLVGRFVAEVSP